MMQKFTISIEQASGRYLHRQRFRLGERDILACGVGLSGYRVRLLGGDDEHLGVINIALDAKITPEDRKAVEVLVDVEVRDQNLNARYAGTVEFVVFSEFEPFDFGTGEPRPDLSVVGMELNQSIQAFRDTEHMTIDLAMPDNGIPLVENKPTCARVYVDYDYTSKVSVGPLTGTLTVIVAGAETALTPTPFTQQDRLALPIASGPTSIVAGPDSIMSRRDPTRTLNFVIPPELCRGTVELRVDVVSTSNPADFAQQFRTEATFSQVTPPTFHLVGVGYAPPGLSVFDLSPYSPPDAPTCDRQLDFTKRMFPLPVSISTSYETASYRETADTTANLPCGSLKSLLNDLEDIRGDRTGVMVGLLPPGYPLGGGCGRRSTQVCAARIDQPDVIAHELGHALGLKHIPCEVGECGIDPSEGGAVNEGYPHYQPYAVGSIGNYGIGIVDNGSAVPNRWGLTHYTPVNSRDVMGYSDGGPRLRWISPYTYLKVMNGWRNAYVAPAPRSLTSFRSTELAQQLILDLTIDRRRATVHLAPTFHYPMPRLDQVGSPTRFSIELLDKDGLVLVAEPVLDTVDEDCGCGCCAPTSWPKTYHQRITFDLRATTIVIYDCDDLIHLAAIAPPPSITLAVSGYDDVCCPHMIVEWLKVDAGPCPVEGLFMVQRQLTNGSWIGVAPRTSKGFALIDKRKLLGTERSTRLRVLASSGLATSITEWDGPISFRECEPEPAPRGTFGTTMEGA